METETKDPRRMTQDDLRGMGFESMPVLKAIREKCIDCSGGSQNEVLLCTVTACTLWPFRMNFNPWRTRTTPKPPTEAQMANRFAPKGLAAE